ncbi:hypothetical protein BsWGS_18093 [Bradybaena similaris]
MASRTGLIPAKVKLDGKAKLASLSGGKSLLALKPQLGKPAGVSKVKGKRESARPALPFRRDLPGKKPTAPLAAKFVKNVAQVGSRDKPVLTGRWNARKSHPGFVSKERTLAKHTTPSRKSLAAGWHTPKSILKKELQDVPDAEKVPAQVEGNADSHHVKFKSKALDQAAMRAKLDAWLEAKGRTTSMSKYRHASCFHTEPPSSASSKRVALLDRNITQNLLTQQMNVLNHEPVKKKLFPGHQMSQKEDKENSQRVLELSSKGALNTNGNAAKSACPEVADPMAELDPGSTYRVPDNLQCEGQANAIMTEKVLHKIEAMMKESVDLLDAGCPLESVLHWFAEMESNMPESLKLATYYIHKAQVVAAFPQMVLEVFCEAVRNNAQPSELIAANMKRTFSKWLTPQDDSTSKPVCKETSSHDLDTAPSTAGRHTPKPARAQRRSSASRMGSIVKYSVGSTNRFIIRTPSNSTVAVVTPVRRSARFSGKQPLSSARLLREVNSVSDISSPERQAMLFQINPALTGH